MANQTHPAGTRPAPSSVARRLILERRSSASYTISDPDQLALRLADYGFCRERVHRNSNQLYRLVRAADRRIIVLYPTCALAQGIDIPGSMELLRQIGGAS